MEQYRSRSRSQSKKRKSAKRKTREQTHRDLLKEYRRFLISKFGKENEP